MYKAICKRSREVVVLKCYLMSSICELYQHQIYREVRLHSTCNHENIINLFAAFQVCPWVLALLTCWLCTHSPAFALPQPGRVASKKGQGYSSDSDAVLHTSRPPAVLVTDSSGAHSCYLCT